MKSILLVIALLSASVHAGSDLQSQIQAVLQMRHPKVDSAWWKSLGPEAPHAIITTYAETSNIYKQQLLIQGLGAFENEETSDFLKKLALNSREDVLRNASIRALGSSQGAKETDFISGFLKNEDPQTRFTAADTLQKIVHNQSDSHAQSILDGYKKEEKTAWIRDRLAGTFPEPTSTLSIVSSSEDRLNPEFNGLWKGYWVHPNLGGPGMVIEAIVLKIRLDGSEANGELVWKTKARVRNLNLYKMTGKGSRLRGYVMDPPPPPARPGVPSIQAPEIDEAQFEISQELGTWTLQGRVPKYGGMIILRKE